MPTQLNKTMTQQYPAVPNFDDQIVPRDAVQYDVFSYGPTFEHVEITDPSRAVTLNQGQLQQHDGQWTLDGTNQTVKQLHKQGIIVISHDQLQLLTTTLPVNDCLIGDVPSAGIRYQTEATVYLVRRTDGEFDFYVTQKKAPVYLNDRRLTSEQGQLHRYDRLVVDGLLLVVEKQQFKLASFDQRDISLNAGVVREEAFQPIYPVDFPKFHRSPRIMLTPPTDKISLNQPESVGEETKNSLVRAILPPLTMVAASLATSVLSGGNPLMSVGMGGASLVTGGLTASAYFTNKKESRKKHQNRTADYEAYLINQTAKLAKLAEQQRHAATYHYPTTDSIAEMIATYNSRLYEKTTNNADFLSFSLGTGYVPASYKVECSANDSKQDDLVKRAQSLAADYQTLAHMPITTTLNQTTLGLVGRPVITNEAIQALYLQLAAFHSYRDVQFITLVPEKDYADVWAKWRWLPHNQIQSLNLRGIVHDTQSKDMVLNSFYQLINKRKQALKEAGHEGIQFAPHYVLTILDESWLNGHQLNEFLAEDMSPYGVSVIWVKEDEAMLPETVTSYAKYDNKDAAELVNEQGHYVAKKFAPLRLPQQHDLAQTIRRLANLHHVEAEKNAIPESVSFLELYKVKSVDQLDVESRWAKANTSKSLAVPLGLRGKDDIVYLNLHERAHGPHGLVAGTTGSGKSETIQSYMLSLAVNFAPEDVGFLPIDFKGGGMANLFKDLPHLLGSITNLDGAGSARALASIRAELQKRQRLFGQYGVNHINGYTKLYKKGKTITDPEEKQKYPDKPLPHLFLISDEFAELKANEPDFMAELVSTARIGRSLGVHLILATQKPSGVVDDQIWSNSRFKLALKVQDAADSNEILKTPDAASIVEPGRAYLQVGNNEIYELFQSAWSGATYGQRSEEANKVDERIWSINNLGQYELLTTDLSSNDDVKEQDTTEKRTELDAVVDYIAKTAKADHAVLPDKPWLPPLGTEIVSPAIDFKTKWAKHQLDTQVAVGELDIPSRQEQKPFVLDFQKLSHTVIFGSAGFGKSTALQTLILNLAKMNSPEELNFNLFDFGTNGLLPLAKLPHVADTVTLDETDKLMKYLRRIVAELDRRKDLFKENGVTSLEQYREKTHKQLPLIVNVLDGFDPVREDAKQEPIELVINQVLREGASLGMYMIMTGLRTNTFKYSMLSNVPTKIALFMVDEGAAKEVVGRDALPQQEIVGRGQIKLDQVTALQFYLPAAGQTDIERLNALDKEVETLAKAWQGSVPAPVPMVPKTLTKAAFFANPAVDEQLAKAILPLGLDKETTDVLGYDLNKHPFFTIVDDLGSQTASITDTLLTDFSKLDENYQKYLIDVNNTLEDQHDQFDVIVDGDESATIMDEFNEELAARKEAPKDKRFLIYIPEFVEFFKNKVPSEDKVRDLLREGYKYGIHIILQTDKGKIDAAFDAATKYVKNNMVAGMVGARITDQQYIKAKADYKEPIMADDEDNFFIGRAYQRIKLIGGEDDG
ncbi:type VII secretion protein EssC [Lacticaseibacillus parahuelsenbergensis]|uniref:Type VII secretion protein EssC n=1 Tax=Lacticaseibacillus parahuelsenbergensis TaxID=3068305 RepID=A0ABY9L0U2_9LACO|nr:type VII secretion protein EssC [Lacticaseibacillus sp. NCIMB 15471]WLV77389.1 type VII secretion protein EssC [Lacticaseibacillus sp. NCIMB 15471]